MEVQASSQLPLPSSAKQLPFLLFFNLLESPNLLIRKHKTNPTLQAMPIEIEKILAAAPATTRGQPTQLSCDPKGERIAYAVSVAHSTQHPDPSDL